MPEPTRDGVPHRTMRNALLVGGGVAMLVLLATVAFVARFDLNARKSALESAISRAAGMEVTIKGKIGLTRWLPPGVSIDGVQFRIRGDPILDIESVRLSSIELVPLLRKQLRVKTCEISGIVATVVKDADGRFNFESTPGRAAPDTAAAAAAPVVLAARLNVRRGLYSYVDRTSGEHAEIQGIEADIRDFAISPSVKKMLRAFSFAGDVACKTVRRGPLTLTDARSPITAVNGRFSLDALTVDVFGGKGAGTVVAYAPSPVPRYEIVLEVPRCRVERLLEGLGKKAFLGGDAALSLHLKAAGRTDEELTKSLAGEVSLTGRDLEAYGLDVDRLIAKVEKTRSFSLVDLGAFFIAGPLGTVATKGYDFARVYRQAQTGHGTLERLVATWKIEAGVAEAEDCALATRRNRVALAGKVDLLHDTYQGSVVSVIDERGCSRFSQRLSGPIENPKIGAAGTLERLAGPLVGIFQRVRRAVAPDAKCDVVYDGSVPQPHEAAGPDRRSRR